MSDSETRPTDESMLLDFLRGRDAPCPLCGYNLRDLTQPVCPECRQDLMLAVGVRRLLLVPLLVTVAPGCFSGIAACILMYPMIFFGPAPLPIYLVWTFGAASGAATIWLTLRRYAFLRQPPRVQWYWAAAVWAVHLAAFGLLVWLAP